MNGRRADSLALLLFPILTVALAWAALTWPRDFAALRGAIVPLLGLVMFCMGTSLSGADFVQVLRRPGTVCLGLGLQFALMPALAFLVGRLLALPDALLTGLVLVGACPGGTASNVMCYLARANVALSVSLTSASTLLAALLTPWLTFAYLGERVDVPVAGMLRTLAIVILLPVGAGVLAARLAGHRLDSLRQVFPLLSMAAIAMIIAIIVGLNASALAGLAMMTLLAVAVHNLAGLGLGWLAARAAGLPAADARALALEVGMQNSGLGVALALKHFSAAAALPGAVFSLWHNLSGVTLAVLWRRADNTVMRPSK